MKVRGWLLMLVFVHVMLHPWVHAISVANVAGSSGPICGNSNPAKGDPISGDQCELCRVGHNAAAPLQLPKTDLLNPHWIHTALQTVNYVSLQADRRLPSRAPPNL